MSRLYVAAFFAVIVAPAAAAPADGPPSPPAGIASGSWPDSIRLELPPAPAGTVPEVALVASHHVTDGIVGSGWSLEAGGVITRHSSTGGVPNHTATDLYRIDGEDLVSVSGPGLPHRQPRTWDGSRFDYVTSSNTWTRTR